MATEQTIVDTTPHMDATADITIRVSGKHGYSNTSGSKPWALTIYWDGQVVNYAGGAGAYTDAPFCEAAVLGASAGDHHLQVTWFGDASMTLRGVNVIADVRYK